MGRASLDDFRILCGLVARLEGGVWLNLGSAVVMPEVFLKTVAIARNLGFSLDGMTTANLDFQQQYRGRLNVLDRPGGAGIALTGHHELLIPLLHAAVVAGIRRPEPPAVQSALNDLRRSPTRMPDRKFPRPLRRRRDDNPGRRPCTP